MLIDVEILAELGEFTRASADHPRRRIVVFRRADGNFTFAEQYHYTSIEEGVMIASGWATLPAEGVYSSLELAASDGQAALKARCA